MIVTDLLNLVEHLNAYWKSVSSKDRKYVSNVLKEIEDLCRGMADTECVDTGQIKLLRIRIQELHSEIGRHLRGQLSDRDQYDIECGLAGARVLFWIKNIRLKTSREAFWVRGETDIEEDELDRFVLDQHRGVSISLLRAARYYHQKLRDGEDPRRTLDSIEEWCLRDISRISDVRRRFIAGKRNC